MKFNILTYDAYVGNASRKNIVMIDFMHLNLTPKRLIFALSNATNH